MSCKRCVLFMQKMCIIHAKDVYSVFLCVFFRDQDGRSISNCYRFVSLGISWITYIVTLSANVLLEKEKICNAPLISILFIVYKHLKEIVVFNLSQFSWHWHKRRGAQHNPSVSIFAFTFLFFPFGGGSGWGCQ